VNVLGLTFKENCPDVRNTKVVDIIHELQSYGLDVKVHDPLADAGEAREHYGVELTSWDDLPQAQALVLAVAHADYVKMPLATLAGKVVRNGCVMDVKAVLDRGAARTHGFSLWRL
jgi:UDP-N-acetyl-D-galactosamine dehydrogenase